MKNIFLSEELVHDRVVSKMETTASNGKRYQVDYYKLDMILEILDAVNPKSEIVEAVLYEGVC